MIRRIVDSVSLLANSQPKSTMDSLLNSISDVEHTHLLNSDYHMTAEVAVSRSIPELSSFDCTVNNSGHSECDSFERSFDSGLLADSSSSYIEPKVGPSISTSGSSGSDDDSCHVQRLHARKQSKSPGVVDLSKLTSRALPGGPSLHHTRHQPVLAGRKKEPHRTRNNGVSCLAIGTGRKKGALKVDSNSETTDGGMANQTDPLIMELEPRILSFYRDLNALELQVPTRYLSNIYRPVLKNLASEYELLILSVEKDRSGPSLILRKRGSLQQKQELQLEEKKRLEMEKRKAVEAMIDQLKESGNEEKREEKEIKMENSKSNEISCQASFDEQGREIGRKRSKRIRKNRERQRRQIQNMKKPKLVDAEMQTVPETYWLCPWCVRHISPSSQIGHEPICRAGVKQKLKQLELKTRLEERNLKIEFRRRERLGLPPISKAGDTKQSSGKVIGKNNGSKVVDGNNHRKSLKTKSNKCDTTSKSADITSSDNVLSKLDEVHPNDIEAMIKLMKLVCCEPKCTSLANSDHPPTGIKCMKCSQSYCPKHRPIGRHKLCPDSESVDVPLAADTKASIACGWDLEEKRNALKTAMRERKAQLRELRERN